MRKKWWLWLLCALLLAYFGSAFLTRCSKEQADFTSVMVVGVTDPETPAEQFDRWLADSLPVRFWQYLASPEEERQAVEEAMESYEMENGTTE